MPANQATTVSIPKPQLPRWVWPRAAYVHIPFCAHLCGYCDFAVAVGQEAKIDLYLDALEAELTHLTEPQPIDTLFIGGGTPTYLGSPALSRLMGMLARWLPLQAEHEFSVEANPGTLDADKIAILGEHGVNRVSLGVQSFQPELLKVLERDHKPADVLPAVSAITRRIANFSVDLIFGVPGQTLEQWAADLDRALAVGAGHISTYGLTYEKGTRLWKQRRRGEVQALDEETELRFYEHAMDRLAAAGFEHYEISNFARPGHRCRHNEVYWANEAYFGFGMGAARYLEGRRELNSRDLTSYLRRALAGEPTTFQSEQLPPEERARETMALQLRRAEGINRRRFQVQTGFELDALAGAALQRQMTLGMIDDDGGSVRLTRRGKCLADAVIQGLL